MHVERILAQVPPSAPDVQAVLARAEEIAAELRLLLAVGTPRFVKLARQRFYCTYEEDQHAMSWAMLPVSLQEDEETIFSEDARDPRSLLSVVRAEIEARKLSVRVDVRSSLGSLAAFGGGVLLIASGHLLTPQVARRTALHEVVGHALPWCERQRTQRLLSPREMDREEGSALRVEERSGFLDTMRRKELGLRHVAAQMAHEEASFEQIVHRMENLYDNTAMAVRLAARAVRGGGLGRERVYLPWYWRSGGFS